MRHLRTPSVAALRAATLAAALLAASCATAPDPYPGVIPRAAGGGVVYEFPGAARDRLLIYLDGSGLDSVIGTRAGGRWTSVHMGTFVVDCLGGAFDVLIPEKPGIGAGEDRSRDREYLRGYTVERLAEAYAREIDGYLRADAGHSKVCLMGASEGGLLLPMVYAGLAERARIDRAVVWGAGGLSQYECFKVLGASDLAMPAGYKAECARVDEARAAIEADPGSVDKFYLGWPYARWASFFNYRPIDFYPAILIPVLFVQGEDDWNSPAESVRYIQRALPMANFEYRFVPGMGHFPADQAGIRDLLRRIGEWLG